MIVRFIAHAGFSIEEDDFVLLLDPWFRDSDTENPIIESIGGGFKTIDFQIPKTREKIEDYFPDAIFVSHFHPHHSSARDIIELCNNSNTKGKRIKIYYPRPIESMELNLQNCVPSFVERNEVLPDVTINVGPFNIQAIGHTSPMHNGWLVSSRSGSVLHIADARLNKDNRVRMPDESWQKLRGLSPTLLLTSTGGHSMQRVEQDGTHTIRDSETLNPVEAAQVTTIIAPKAVSLMGMYNHSVWKNRHEYILATPIVEEQFQWAISWLSPNIKNIRLTPGYTIAIGETEDSQKCDAYLKN